jgi:hypothetical protein
MKNCKENISASNSLRRRGHDHNNDLPGMLRLRATQNPTLAVNAGKNTCQNWPVLASPGTNCEGADNIGPNPPAFVYAQASNVADKTVKIGELYLSNHLMLAIPFHMNANCNPPPPPNTHTQFKFHSCFKTTTIYNKKGQFFSVKVLEFVFSTLHSIIFPVKI